MCRRYRCLVFLMLLWLPVKGVLSAAMPFHEMGLSANAAAMQVSHCQMSQGAVPMMAMMGDAESAPASILGHEPGGYSQSLTCHGLCAVFLATDFVFPLGAVIVDPPAAAKVAFCSHIPELPDRPPVL